MTYDHASRLLKVEENFDNTDRITTNQSAYNENTIYPHLEYPQD